MSINYTVYAAIASFFFSFSKVGKLHEKLNLLNLFQQTSKKTQELDNDV